MWRTPIITRQIIPETNIETNVNSVSLVGRVVSIVNENMVQRNLILLN